MRKHLVPHTAKWVAVCLACIYGSLIFQGCGGDDPAPEANPYAALEEAFPEGMPGLDDVDVRAQDKAYLESIYQEGAAKAQYLANKTLRKVYKKVGFVPAK